MSDRTRGHVLLALVVGAGLILGTAGCSSGDGSRAERQKAEALEAKLEPLGIDVDVETDTIISLYGDDGGKVCEVAADPAAMEREGLLAHPRFALRKTEVGPDAIAYTKAVIEVYCPEQLANVEDYIEGLRVDDGN